MFGLVLDFLELQHIMIRIENGVVFTPIGFSHLGSIVPGISQQFHFKSLLFAEDNSMTKNIHISQHGQKIDFLGKNGIFRREHLLVLKLSSYSIDYETYLSEEFRVKTPLLVWRTNT